VYELDQDLVIPTAWSADGAGVMLDLRSEPTDGISPLEALLELPRSASEDSLGDFLVTVADTVCRTCGFTTVVLNLFRPAWDDYEVALVVGDDDSVDALMGTTLARSSFKRILTEAPQRVPSVFFLPEEAGFWGDLEEVYTPALTPVEHDNAWLAGDGILAFLSDADGAPLAFVSMDEPASGLRPSDDDLRLISAICSHAESALESAQRKERVAENARVLSLLLETSPALLSCSTTAELFEMAGRTVVPHLGFERFAAYSVEDESCVLSSTRGWEDTAQLPAILPVAEIDELLAPAHEQAGCFIGSAAELFSDIATPKDGRSRRNGHGANAWSDHCIVVPCRADHGGLRGLIVIEDPTDRLLPSANLRRQVRLLVDQVAAALVTVDHRARLHHLASHDPLTGVRNRRGLDDVVAAHHEVALLVCDLDHFKQVNDRYGHELGDQVLARFGELLRELARESDVPMRLGGEEFCVVLPGTDHAGAIHAAERLRLATMEGLTELVPGGLTVSIGVAATAIGVLDARGLMATADRGLYAAKAAGRNRSVLGSDDG
jgi:diguanylate cyclase (GGDEF)-like protein